MTVFGCDWSENAEHAETTEHADFFDLFQRVPWFQRVPRFRSAGQRRLTAHERYPLLFITECETEFEVPVYAHRLAVFLRRLEANLHCRLDGFLGQTVRQSSNHSDVADLSVSAENDTQDNRALDIIVFRFLCVLGLLSVQDRRPQRGRHLKGRIGE